MVGSGRASKLQIQKAVQARLRLTQLPEPNDVADALALALCHWQAVGGPGRGFYRIRRGPCDRRAAV